MSDVTWRLVRPFGIDDGELDGMSSQECFVLGYELCMIDALIDSCEAFAKPVHAANKRRISQKLTGRRHTMTYIHDDQSETWLWLDVPAKGAAT